MGWHASRGASPRVIVEERSDEESYCRKILRFAQDDKGEAQDDKGEAQDDKGGARDDK